MPGNQASAVPQGDVQRRASPESEDVTDQPAATHIRVEEARRTQWTMSSTVEDILLEGSTNRTDMKLNDFLRSNLGEEWIVERNGNVAMEAFLLRPTMFINDNEILGLITALPSYQELEERKILLEAINKLHHEGVHFLEQWKDYKGKATLTPLVSEKLNGVLAQIQREEKREANERAMLEAAKVPEAAMLEGCYESVYNASWHHVVEVPGGEGTVMKVKEGKPKQSWTYNEVGETLEKVDGVQQSGAPRLRLMVLTSDEGWPYSWEQGVESLPDCYVNCEVERVWQIVKSDLTAWFSTHPGTYFTPKRRVLVGTPGIGKSMNAGSYLLYQLLQYDVEQLQMVAYVIGNRKLLFDKTAKTVEKYSAASNIEDILGSFSRRGVKGYIIYDVALKGHQPPAGLPFKGWGMIVVTSPNKNNYESWAKLVRAKQIIINCPDGSDVRAMCVWMKHNGQLAEEEADYWKKVNGRMDKVGPLLRYIFDDSEYKSRIDSCESKVKSMNLFDTYYYSILGTNEVCDDSHISHKVVKVERLRGGNNLELPLNALISSYLGNLVTCKLAELMAPNDFILLVLAIKDDLLSKALEKHSVFTFLSEGFVNAIIPKLTELKLEENTPPHRCALELYPHERPLKPLVLQCLENFKEKIKIEYGVLYKPVAQNFPLVDAFFFMESPQKTLVGLQITTASEHHTIPSTVNLFKENMAKYFNNWEELSRVMSWEIIYVQHADSTPMTGWQRCGPANPDKLSPAEKKTVAFWNAKVHQYQVSVSSRDFKEKEKAPPIMKEKRKKRNRLGNEK